MSVNKTIQDTVDSTAGFGPNNFWVSFFFKKIKSQGPQNGFNPEKYG